MASQSGGLTNTTSGIFNCRVATCFTGREGTLICLLHLSPKFYYNVFLFVGLTTLETFIKFDWLVYQFECPNVSTSNCNLQKG